MLSTTALSSATSAPIWKIGSLGKSFSRLQLTKISPLRDDEGAVSHLRGDEGGGDTEVEGEEEREDCEQGVQVQHGHHFVLPQTCLSVDKRKHYCNFCVCHKRKQNCEF